MPSVSAQRKPIEITPKMPPDVARVAKALNSLNLPPDPLIYDEVAPGQGTSYGGSRAERLVREISGFVGGLEGKSVIDVACGEVHEETKETVTLETLRRICIKLSLYVGIDPTIPARLLGEQEIDGVRAIYLPISLYELDDSAVRGIGNVDIVMSTLFFGLPMYSGTAKMSRKIASALDRLSFADRRRFDSENPGFDAVMMAAALSFGTGGPIRDFVEFMAQNYCRRLIREGGLVAHFVLLSEPEPDVEMARAAGLELKHSAKIGVHGTGKLNYDGVLTLFEPV